jgi:hypothetical protein
MGQTRRAHAVSSAFIISGPATGEGRAPCSASFSISASTSAPRPSSVASIAASTLCRSTLDSPSSASVSRSTCRNSRWSSASPVFSLPPLPGGSPPCSCLHSGAVPWIVRYPRPSGGACRRNLYQDCTCVCPVRARDLHGRRTARCHDVTLLTAWIQRPEVSAALTRVEIRGAEIGDAVDRHMRSGPGRLSPLIIMLGHCATQQGLLIREAVSPPCKP